MSDEANTYQLLVRQTLPSNPQMEILLQTLMQRFGVDAYTARIRLTGSGKALFAAGSREQTGRLAELLRTHGYQCWVIQRSAVAFTPVRMQSMRSAADRLDLSGHDQSLSLPRGASVVAVLADLSGKLEERMLQRNVVQRRYKDARHVTSMADEKMMEAVLKGTPVLDLYLLTDQGEPKGAVRVFPGRFDAKGLGERMTMSATRNLVAMIDVAREYAGHISLHLDFGLGRIPDCTIKSLDGTFVDQDQRLKSLTRFGWLMCDLEQDSAEEDVQEVEPLLAAAAVAAGQPALAAALASANLEAAPGLAEVVKEIKAATAETVERAKPGAGEVWLPTPPDRTANKVSLPMVWSSIGGFLLAGFLVLLSQGETSLLRAVGTYGVQAGIGPALAAVALLWSGFHFVRLKRRIEDTPTSRIRSLAMGLVEIHGNALRKYALVSPLNQSPCVYYRLRKYKKDNRNRWTLVSDKDSRHVPFLIDDGSGQVIVDPAGATVRSGTSRSGLPGEEMLAFHGVSTDDPDEKWVEDIIHEGTALYVLGYAQPLKEQRRTVRELTLEKLRNLKLDRQALRRYDADGDGRISEDEWQSARSDAEQQALKEHLAQGGARKRQEEHVIIARPPQRGLPFVIAEAVDEAQLVRKCWFISMPLIACGLLAAGFALYYFLNFIGI